MRTDRSFSGFLGFLIAVLAAAEPAFAGSPPAAVTAARASTILDAHSAAATPRINGRVPSRLRSALESGFGLAVQRLSNEPACRDLFTRLGADGVEMLSTTLYYQASLKMEKAVCSDALAYTVVGGAPTWVCQRFARLNERRAAAVLLHEALHHAGMDEWPHDLNGLAPAAIDDLVEKACGW